MIEDFNLEEATETGEALMEFKSDSVNSSNTKLRPVDFSDYVGQDKAKKQLKLAIESAKIREDSLDHVLLYGPPGLGKTTLAMILAKEMNVSLRTTSGPALEKQGDLAAILTSLQEGEVLFIDEIHRLKKNLEEVLYSAMEDRFLDVIVGTGPTARSIKLDLPKFTLVGATTLVHKLAAPLRDRFGLVLALDFYNIDELKLIIKRSASLMSLSIKEEALELIAHCCRQTPRIANRILKQVRDYVLVNNHDDVDLDTVTVVLKMIEIDEKGLQRLDRQYLDALVTKFTGGPVGLKTLAAALNTDQYLLAEVVEPFLLKIGFLQRTSRGRIVTPSGKNYILA